MPTLKQTELIDELISKLDEDEKSLCKPVIEYLLELGYTPKKHKKGIFAVSFEKKGRKIVRFEYGKRYKSDPDPYLSFCLRYSASNDCSPKFQKPITKLIEKHEEKHGTRMGEWNNDNCCGNCKGNPRFYSLTKPDGTKDSWCGGFSLVFTDLTSGDVPEILKHIKNQDAYFDEILSV